MHSTRSAEIVSKGGEVMSNKHEDHTVQCPYYKTNNSTVIYCEGVEDGMVTHMAFARRDLLIQYKDKYCRRKCWGQCPLASLLNRKWGYDE